MDSSLPVIKDVVVNDTIGHGTFAQVKSAHLKVDSSVIIAVKFVHIPTCQQYGLSEKDVVGEVILQSKCCKHHNVLKVIDCNIAHDYLWIAMEMADGGDLFDKIEPDIGVDSEVAQFYFQQLVSAVSYLHEECGVAHRDIKPENLLLDKNGNLKLADFGLASKFRRKDGSKRLCYDQRGSPQYMAPEILHYDEYYADVTDIWSIGVLLFVILTGELPWDLPVFEDENFQCFMENNGKLNVGPWAKIDFTHLNLLRKLLQPDPLKRVSLRNVQLHPWFNAKATFADDRGLCKDPKALADKLLSSLKISLTDDEYMKFTQTGYGLENGLSSTQPVKTDIAAIKHDSANVEKFAFTQKLSSQYNVGGGPAMTQEPRWTQYLDKDIAFSQFRNDDPLPYGQRLFNPLKLTKFYTVEEMELVLSMLEEALRFANISVRPDLNGRFSDLCSKLGYDGAFPLHINLKSKDRRGANLHGFISIALIEENLKCISFERKSGDPLEWRRLFKKIALFCRELVLMSN
ncbi:Chk1 protein kinase [Zygosaccharomyces mellis]|uniref:non-specific serine/threonine protein kinase n=1 Tax=Zygosaccharomyces mellis TaxID=42258 RepID=A0A4C2E4F0_9SACH|nr:Chk1 protein kinase [Zygosaccharomyces mellis]